MVGYQDGNRTILTAIPRPPASFSNITAATHTPGTYILGFEKFNAAPFPIASFFHRNTGIHDEIILGILSVVIIGLLSDIVYTILTRSRRDRSASGIRMAYYVDQISHFRNFCSHITSSRSTRASARSRPSCLTSLIAITIAVFIFAMEVVTIILTQSNTTFSTKHQYNLQGLQPIGTTSGKSRFNRRRVGDQRGCVTPNILKQKQTRHFLVAGCVHHSSNPRLTEDIDVSDYIDISSFYHRGGSDHNVSFGEGWHAVSIRARLFVNGNAKYIFFNSGVPRDSILYIQKLVIYAAMEWSCNWQSQYNSCESLVSQLSIISSEPREEKITLWKGSRKGIVTTMAKGLVTRFSVPMHSPYYSLNAGIHPLFSSSAIIETSSRANYSNIATLKEEDGIPGLISDEGRIAGVYLLTLLLVGCVVIIIIMRMKLRPITLGRVAMESIPEEDEYDPFEEYEKRIVQAQRESHAIDLDEMDMNWTRKPYALPNKGKAERAADVASSDETSSSSVPSALSASFEKR